MGKLIIMLLFFTLSAQAQVDSAKLKQYKEVQYHFENKVSIEKTKIQIEVAIVNLVAMAILSQKYTWDARVQGIVTPFVIGGAIGFTFGKAVQYKRLKL